MQFDPWFDGGRTMTQAVKFDQLDKTQQERLEQALVAADSRVGIAPPAPTPGGAPLATTIIIALIGGGAVVIGACVQSFGAYLAAKNQGPSYIIIRGSDGSVPLVLNGKTLTEEDKEAITRATEKVGTVTEVVETAPPRHA